jgi:predicted metal-dependent phosphotriesterase family hydrolase
MTMKDSQGQVLTARGRVPPTALGAVLMHEHLHSDMYRWETDEFVTKEAPTPPERRDYLLRDAVPHLLRFRTLGCYAYVEVTPEPWRAWPTTY